jgi:glycosyltransferase involved in cell wall biosynthesis
MINIKRPEATKNTLKDNKARSPHPPPGHNILDAKLGDLARQELAAMSRQNLKLAVIATHLRPALGYGGVAECTAELILAWRAAGRDVSALTSDGTRGPTLTARDFEETLQAQVTLYRAHTSVRWGFGLGVLTKALFCIGRSEAVYISGVATWPTTIAALYARLLGRPYFIALHGGLMREHWESIQAKKPFKALFYKCLTFPALRNATGVHVMTELERSEAETIVPNIRFIVVPNGLSLPGSEEVLPSPPHSGVRLLFLGRIAPEKGILAFIQRFLEVGEAQDELRLGGAYEADYGVLVSAACAQSTNITHLGVLGRNALLGALRDVDALVLPSGMEGGVRENFGNVVVEALLAGRPVMVTRGIAWDQIDADGVGVTFDRNGSDLAEALAKLKSLLATEGLAARCADYARSRYSPPVIAEQLWDKLTQLSVPATDSDGPRRG